MNDRFRFRAWDKKNKNFIFDIEDENKRDWEITELEQCRYFGEYLCMPERYIVEQCTGLKDKSGRLIYEGDIVNILCEVEEQGVLEWASEEAQFVIRAERAGFVADFDNYNGIDLEVIGNIHENPELLEAQNV